MKFARLLAVVLSAGAILSCDKGTTTTPSRVVVIEGGGGTGGGTAIVLTAPEPASPSDQVQLSTLRPTLSVRNGTSNQAGTRTYEFQISDRSDFTSMPPEASPFAVVVTGSVSEDGSGTTSFTPSTDLQPTTRFYWRARVMQGAASSDWSNGRSFNSKLVGYNRAGELYDPLIHSETIGARNGSTTFVDGKGIRINDQNSFVRYQLAQPLSNGEFSVEVEGLYPNGPGEKLKVMSMMDGGDNLWTSKYLLNAMYRGQNGNPANCIAFKAIWGDNDFILEPDLATRNASVVSLDPARTYLWKITLSTNEFRLQVLDGGVNGTSIYNRSDTARGGAYNPNPHTAYLGANNGPFGQETGSFPGLTYRNLWIGNRARPASLGSALSRMPTAATPARR